MEFYLDQQKTLKFQLSSPDMSDEGKNALEGQFILKMKDLSIAFPVEINENWVATVEVPQLNRLLKTTKEGSARASMCLHDSEYFFKVWDEDVELVKGRPELKAKAVEDGGKKRKKNKRSKAVVEATMIEEEADDQEPEESEEVISEDRTPSFQKPSENKLDSPGGLKSYLDHIGPKE